MNELNVGLVDIDSHNFPNLVLMKISAYFKSRGDYVYLLQPDDLLKDSSLFVDYDLLYGACVFSQNEKIATKLGSYGVYVGGTGSNNNRVLEDEMEHIMPDYSLYGITDTAYGFLTRGCPRACPFCIVSAKEGAKSRKVADLSEWWAGQKFIKLLDPNLLACPEHEDLLAQLANSRARVDVTQGFDARLLTERNMELINRLKLEKIHLAWDNPKDDKIKEKLKFFIQNTTMSVKHRKPCVYVLTNYWSTHEEDLYRIYWLRDNGFDPYVMIYDKPNAPKETRYLQRWVNNKQIFRVVPYFSDYDAKRG